MGLMKKLTSAIVASSLVLSLVGTAAAAYTPAAGETAGKRMQDLKILMGKPGVGLDLNGEITRAELVTVIVRAFGKEADAQLLKGSTAFPDIANHWASGNIAMAKALVEKAGSDAIGMPDGTFAPDAKLTAAQAVAFLMKFVGVKADASKTWPANYLDVAVEKNIITAEDKALIAPQLNANATRGLVFYMFDRAFYGYNLPTGKTFYTQYVDTMGPEVTLNAIDATTIDSKVTVTGNVKDAVSVFVGTTAVTPDASGNFTANYDLPELKDYTITVTARDLAGNTTEKSAKVTRAAGTAAAIEAADLTVAAGGVVEVKAVVKDAKGNVLATPVTGTATVGTYADGKYTAGTAVGTATVTLKAGEVSKDVKVTVTAGEIAKVVADKVSAAPGEIVTLTAQDANGNAITGATFSQTSADAMLDSTTGKFMASKAGNYTVTAKVGTVEKTATIGVFSGFGSTAKVVVEAPDTIVGNGETVVKVTAKVVDANGNVITSFDGNIAEQAIAGLTFDELSDKNGVATYEVKASNNLTGQALTLNFDATKGLTTVTGKDTMQVIQQVATSVKVDAPTYLAVNNSDGTLNAVGTSVKVWVLDQNGEAMLTGAYAVTVDLTGTAITFNNDQTAKSSKTVVYDGNVNAAAGAAVTVYPMGLTTVGEVTATGTLTGLTAGTDKVTAAYAQAAAQVVASVTTTDEKYVANVDADATEITFKAQLKDANGVPATATADKVVTFDLGIADFSKVKVYPVVGGIRGAVLADNPTATIATGTNSISITLESETFLGDMNVTAKVTNLTSGTTKATFVAGDAYSVAFTKTKVKVAQGTEAIDLTAQIYDKAGNKVPKSGQKIYFTADGTSAWVNGSDKATVETDVNGAATVKATTIGYYSVFNGVAGGYVANIDLAPAATNLVEKTAGAAMAHISVDNSVATSLTVKAQVGLVDRFQVATSDFVTLIATAKDAKLQKLVNETVKVVFPKGTVLGSADAAGNYVPGVTANAGEITVLMPLVGDTYQLAGVQFAKAPSVTYTVKDTAGVSDLTATGTIAVQPSVAAKIKVTSADSDNKIAYTKGSVSGPFTIQLTDAYGNPVFADASTGDIAITWLYPAVNAATGEYFELKASTTGARLTGDAAGSKLSIKQGGNSATFYVFGNVDVNDIVFDATRGVAGAAITSSAQIDFDAQ